MRDGKRERESNSRAGALSSPVRWIGGKGNNRHWILAHFPPHECYVESFGGGGSVLLAKSRSRVEIYNDRDARLCEIFRVLRSRTECQELARLLRLTPYHEAEYSRVWREPLPRDRVERTRRFVLQLRAAFGGAGSRGTHPGFGFGKSVNQAASFRRFVDRLGEYVGRLRDVQVMCRDAVDVIRRFDGPDTLHYVDPPYVHSTRKGSRDYLHEMTDEDHARLAAVLVKCRGRVIVSGYPGPLYANHFRGWRTVDREQSLTVSRTAKHARRVERLWLNF